MTRFERFLLLEFFKGKEFEQGTLLSLFGYSKKSNMVDTKLYRYVRNTKPKVWKIRREQIG